MTTSYQICTRCVMDTSDPLITFDAEGVCSHCHEFDVHHQPQILGAARGKPLLDAQVARMKEQGKGKPYDCIIGLSGGVDSSYVAHLVVQLGLRPLAVHVDTGWNSELAVSNIEKIVSKLKIDLYTTVIDWEEMRDLQLAFFKASVANCDVPQDHTFVAVLFNLAAKHGVHTIISGHNLQSESIMPVSWGYTSIDAKHLRAIQRQFGSRKLKSFPTYSIFQYSFWWPYVRKIRIFKILNYCDYRKDDVKQWLMDNYDWRDYGGKHYESQFTKFFQSYYLPTKFGFDKRRAHLASLVVSGQLARAQAMQVMQAPPFDPAAAVEDKAFVAKKLSVSVAEFDAILQRPPKTYRDYPSHADLIARLLDTKLKLAAWRARVRALFA